jgi:hypothetical protein
MTNEKKTVRSEKQWRQTKLTVHHEIYATTKKDYHRQLYECISHYFNVILDKNENYSRWHWKILKSCLGRVATNTLLANQFNAFFIKKVAEVHSSAHLLLFQHCQEDIVNQGKYIILIL